ncbi:hypothetical protein V6N11_008436 [Hibiscus sabdariffa]|uniref:Uncharacterized protein n=2 Tax=Hibiscus sabdariffa TaxID=183260 RepID=A0ABR2DWP1_9ROSI
MEIEWWGSIAEHFLGGRIRRATDPRWIGPSEGWVKLNIDCNVLLAELWAIHDGLTCVGLEVSLCGTGIELFRGGANCKFLVDNHAWKRVDVINSGANGEIVLAPSDVVVLEEESLEQGPTVAPVLLDNVEEPFNFGGVLFP